MARRLKPKQITLELLQDTPMKSIAAQSSNVGMNVAIQTLVKGHKYRLDITPTQTDQTTFATVTIHCQYGDEDKTFRAYATVKPPQASDQLKRTPLREKPARSQSARARGTIPDGMKTRVFPKLPAFAVVLVRWRPLVNVRAQDPTTTTTTTTVDHDARSADRPRRPFVTVQPTAPRWPVVERVAGQHVVEIELAVSRGSVQAYFGRAPRGEKVQIGSAELSFKLPSTATVTKLTSRDDDSAGSHKVTADHPWRVTVPFDGAGRYVFNISDWSDDPVVTALVVKVDGVTMFAGTRQRG